MNKLSVLATATLLALGVASTADAGGRPDLVKRDLLSGKSYEQGQLIVQYRSFATDADKARVQKLLGGSATSLAKRGGRLNYSGDLDLVQMASTASLAAKMDLIANDPAVAYAEPNWNVRHMATSNDPYFTNGSLWGMYGSGTTPANQYGSGAAAAWTRGADCSNVVVGIIDEGYMYTHPELAANAYKNPGDSSFDGIDNDSNGLVDDVYGWDFDGGDNSVFDGAGDDHGTHVAGTIGGIGGNGAGVAGVCWNVKLMSAKFLGRRGGSTANAIKSVDYFTALKNRGVNIVATNNSWGGGGYSQALADAIERHNQAGILFIAAAGNDGINNDTTASYPSGYSSSNVIAVASITSTGAMSSFSQYGAQTVDICAPGSAINSTVPVSSKGAVVAGYASYSGTSMATPHVTGAAALYKARNPSATAAQIKSALFSSATPTASCAGKVSTGARLNVSGF